MDIKEIKEDGYQHRMHNKNLLMAHIICVTKYRKKILIQDIDADVKQLVYKTCCSHHWYIRAMETDKDHIHLLLQYNPVDCISSIVSTIKQYTTYYLWKTHGDFLRQHYWKNTPFGPMDILYAVLETPQKKLLKNTLLRKVKNDPKGSRFPL